MDSGHWTLPEGIKQIPKDAIGFVYKITEKSTGKYYYGIKLLYKTVKLKPLKGTKRKRKVIKDSDWKTYTTSGSAKQAIDANPNKYTFEILSFHSSKTSMKVEEARLITDNVYNTQCYNQMINLRVNVTPKMKAEYNK